VDELQKELTPMMRQYFEIKNQYKDCILFYRLGDFYEMFYEDAKIVSSELELTLTGKNCGGDERAPMCGVPFHSYEGYAARLIAKGYKVAICEQTEDPALAKGLVKREVLRVLTPGTVTDSAMLPEKANNYLCMGFADDKKAALCFCDVSTGEAQVTILPCDKTLADAVLEECRRFVPTEVRLSEKLYEQETITKQLHEQLHCRVERAENDEFLYPAAPQTVRNHFGADSPVCEEPYAVYVLGGLLSYLAQTQKTALTHLHRAEIYDPRAYMTLDHVARRNLELFETMRGHEKRGSLLWVLDRTHTAMGARCLKQWLEKPLINPAAIRRRHNGVASLVGATVAREELIRSLGGVLDMERLISRVSLGTANARDLVSLAAACANLPDIKYQAAALEGSIMQELSAQIDELQDVYEAIHACLVDEPPVLLREGGLIREGFHAEADELRDLAQNGRGKIAQVEARERERTGIKNLKVSYNKVFGYYIEVSKSNLNLVPDDYIRKQTLVNGERFITEELKKLEGSVLGAQERIKTLEYELFCRLRDQVALQTARVQRTAQAVAQLDVLCAFAELAVKNDYVMPDVDGSDALIIRDGRHPVVEQMLPSRSFVPNDTTLDCNRHRVAIITGPNMAGKSTFMRQTALIVLMAQIGSFVPAASAKLGVVDRIFTRIGASDDLAAGQSTFMVEMSEVATIIREATARSLLILDEIGRGTSTYDGMSIARAVLEYAADKKKLGAKTMFATHYHELTQLADLLDGVENYSTAVRKRGDDITFLRRIIAGGADDSYGIEVAKLAGVPETVIRRAKEILKALESDDEVRTVGKRKKVDEEEQTSLADFGATELVSRVRNLPLDDLTPMQALNLLYELKAVAQRLP